MTSPSSTRNAYDLTLTDNAANKLDMILCDRSGKPNAGGWQRANSPKTSLKITSGNEGYGDFELPFSSIVQSDFSGGRGARDFERDTTRYSDGYRCDTNRANEFRCGPKATQGSGYNLLYTTGTTQAGNYTNPTAGVTATFTQNTTIEKVKDLQLSPTIFDTDDTLSTNLGVGMTISLAASPYTLLASSVCHMRPEEVVNGSVARLQFSFLPITLTAGVQYTITVSGTWLTPITQYLWPLVADTGESVSGLPSGSAVSDKTLMFTVQTAGYGRSIIFDYRGRKLAVTQPDDMEAPRLWMQGYHGMGADNAADKSKINTALNLTGIDLVGKYARIVSGPGSAEETPWRKITGNTATGTNDTISVAPNWNITHTTSTEFVIQGCTSWQELTSTSGSSTSMAIKSMSTVLTAPVTDVLVVDDIIYFAMGETTAIARTRFNAGVWAEMVADASTNKLTYLELVQDETGKKKIWGAQKSTSAINEADKVAWGTNLTFAAALVCGDTSSQITGLLAAKISGPMLPIIFKETEFGAVSGSSNSKVYDTFYQFQEARDDFNGRSAIQPDLYLWFSLMDGIERYYDQRLDDVGPNRDEGLPLTRKGRVSYMVKYFSQIYAAYDAGRYGYSSILRFNGVGWCEVYRGAYGRRIRAMNIDILPDLDNADRLWFSEEEDIYYIPIGLDPDKVNGYVYFTGSQLETAWIYGPYRDITKYWDSLAVFSRNATANVYVTAEYKVDSDANAWVALPTTFTTSPVQENPIATLRNVTGKCIKFRLTLTTNSTSITPVVTALRVNAVIRVKPKAIWNVTCTVSDGKEVDRQDQVVNGAGVNTAITRLEGWQDGTTTPIPLTTSGYHAMIDGKRGFVDNVSMQPIEVTTESGAAKILALISFQFVEV